MALLYMQILEQCRLFGLIGISYISATLQDPAKRGDMWVLKKEVHRGKGVHVLPLRTAIRDGKKMEEMYDVVQKYIGNQMTVLGRKFYVR